MITMTFNISRNNSAHKLVLHEIEKLVNDMGISFVSESHDIDRPSTHNKLQEYGRQNSILYKELCKYMSGLRITELLGVE